ncbi:MAG TPA: hypothetical protein VJN18_08085, partial [Polyangiaceae bacterium]|nr:hypothetical protein [Polyangiaceae bacterium]
PAQQPYASDPNAQPGYGSAYGEPPPPPPPPEKKESPIPPFSVRLDPLNWIIRGRLGFEVEVGIVKWMTVETVPIFVTTESPPFLNLNTDVVKVAQRSDGLGPLAGASLGVNFWLSGKALKGYAIGTGITNYSIEYESTSDAGTIDKFSHTERNLYFMFGSLSRWGAFTIGGGIGFGYDLNSQTRCFRSDAQTAADAELGGDCGAQNIVLQERRGPTVPFVAESVTSFVYPWSLMARFSLGVAID